MAAPGRHVGHYIQKNSRFLLNNIEQLWCHSKDGKVCMIVRILVPYSRYIRVKQHNKLVITRNISCSSAQRQEAASIKNESVEAIVIPRKKSWSKEAVLEALLSTVNRDPTAYPYQFQDDPYLAPRNSAEFKLYSLSQESGRAAAKYFIDNNPKFFTKDFAEPHIPCLMPVNVSLQLEEISEEALKERINLRKVSAATDMYDQLLQAGKTVSKETSYDLLDLICLYGDRDPLQETEAETDDTEVAAEEARRKRGRARWASDLLKSVWKENNNVERIFSLLPERDGRCYSALIRGMVKHGAYVKAYNMYTDMLNNRLTADVHTFNALISATPELREKYNDRWDLMAELLNQMRQQKVQPNLLTFNSLLKALRRCGSLARTHALHTLCEMKALGIAPSLATFDHLLGIFYKGAVQNQTDILQEVMSELADASFTCQDPDDVLFFSSAMRVCIDTKDLETAYKLHSLMGVGENWRLLGDSYQQSVYFGRFFSLLCLMEHIDVVLKWYRELIPSMYFPNPQGMRDLLQALDTDSRLDLLPSIWKDIRSLGHDNKSDLVEELLALMAREKHSPEVQESFAECVLDVRSVFEGDRDRGRPRLEWSTSSLSHVTSLLLRANRSQQAWEMLQLFKANNRVPSDALLESFLSLCVSNSAPNRAVELVQLSAAFCLPATPKLAGRALAEFDLNEEQRALISDLEKAWESTD